MNLEEYKQSYNQIIGKDDILNNFVQPNEIEMINQHKIQHSTVQPVTDNNTSEPTTHNNIVQPTIQTVSEGLLNNSANLEDILPNISILRNEVIDLKIQISNDINKEKVIEINNEYNSKFGLNINLIFEIRENINNNLEKIYLHKLLESILNKISNINPNLQFKINIEENKNTITSNEGMQAPKFN